MNRKTVGDKLFLSLNVGEDLPGGFVGAFLYDENDNLLSNHDLDYVADGVFSESNATMPSVQKLIVVYKVFTDAARTQVDNEFPFVNECFEQDVVLNALQNFSPKGVSVESVVRTQARIIARVSQNQNIKAVTRPLSRAKVEIRQARIQAIVRPETRVKGVVNDV